MIFLFLGASVLFAAAAGDELKQGHPAGAAVCGICALWMVEAGVKWWFNVP